MDFKNNYKKYVKTSSGKGRVHVETGNFSEISEREHTHTEIYVYMDVLEIFLKIRYHR